MNRFGQSISGGPVDPPSLDSYLVDLQDRESFLATCEHLLDELQTYLPFADDPDDQWFSQGLAWLPDIKTRMVAYRRHLQAEIKEAVG